MSPVILSPPFTITIEHTDALKEAIKRRLSEVNDDDLFNVFLIADGALVISFDNDWAPFIGFGHGYNEPDHRIYLPRNIHILNLCAESLERQGMDIPGGRVFINNKYAFHKIGALSAVICIWNWKGSNFVSEISSELNRERIKRGR
jgi:hypothetical protein